MDADPVDYERIVQEVYEAILRPGDTALDVGAHVGRHSFPMARCVWPDGRVFAFEPLPQCRRQIARRLAAEHPELTEILTVCPQALSDWPGEAPFTVAEDALHFSGLHAFAYPTPTRVSQITVAVETVDRLFHGGPVLRYVKLDAEGAELHILRGAAEVLARHRPIVGFEFGISANEQYAITPADMARFWADQGYRVYGIHGGRLGEPHFVASALRHAIWDYMAVPAEDAAAERAVCEVLGRARVNWLAAGGQLRRAEMHAPVGAAVPPLQRLPWPLRGLGRAVVRVALRLAQVVTRPQRACNQALVRCLRLLADGLEKAENERGQRDVRLRALEDRVERLERELARRPEQDPVPTPGGEASG
jgi:FkbM family methyltransferase